MEKYRMHPIMSGKNVRMSYSDKREVMEMPDLIEVQKSSYKWFLEKGLREAFDDISPITGLDDKLSLEFADYQLCDDEKKYSIEECKERDATYSAPLKVNVKLHNRETGEIKRHDIFMGDIPIMTDTGTFIVNGAEKVIVSQLVRSPGIYFGRDEDKLGKVILSCTVIPNRGAWLEYESDAHDVLWVKVNRARKVAATVFMRALGLGTNEEILELFGEEPKILATLEKDECSTYKEGLLKLYSTMKPQEPPAEESAEAHINGILFNPKRYDLAKVGRYKFNKKLALRNRITGYTITEDVVDPTTGEVICEAGTVATRELADEIQNAAVPFVVIQASERNVKVLSNLAVDLAAYGFDPEELGIDEMVYYPVLSEILENFDDEDEIKAEIKSRMSELIPTTITKEDIFASISYELHLEYKIGSKDDTDHLGNKRVKSFGELLLNQYRIGLTRIEKNVRDKMNSTDIETVSPQSLININLVKSVVKEFFGSSQLSQFMDQNNPLSELTHKRRLSALGPGGLSRDRAGFEVRDVHYTHYGRVCPVETPEGPNIGLINSLASYARINKYGFIEAPYRKIDKTDPENPVVTDEVVYLTADEEDNYYVAQASEALDSEGHFIRHNVTGRHREDIAEFPRSKVDLMDISPRMVFSVATSLIPFLQNDDANRALMGSNMQRQAVPLLVTDSPVVGTGMEYKAAVDSGSCLISDRNGRVEMSSSEMITIKDDEDGMIYEYPLAKFKRSNQGNCMNQRPIVFNGDKVKKGEVIADGASTHNGELALGKNPLIGFMTWEGYNYEDAVLLSERLVKEDVYTSIHIEKYETEARSTKLGPEEITRDLSGLSQDALKDLDEDGIVRIGAEVRAEDILVGKVTPKGETELTPSEKILRAIFDEKATEVRDTSLRLPHGAYGIVMDVKVFSRENGDELPPGVDKKVRVYIAQKRKISVGDKMAGRHGNKGVVSRVLPVEDMPFLPNGRPLDIVLNPLGVPSRMNIGQILELHLGLASEVLGFKVSTPIFDGAHEEDITAQLEMANDYANTEWEEFEAKYKDKVSPEVMDYLYKNRDHRNEWKGVPIDKTGKVVLRDGRTGKEFPAPISIGYMHYLKLHHLVDDKIHARSTGPYSLVTQQPLGGKAQFGGQRFGEMEVWALEAYGASATLREILTVKSDDVVGRVKTYEAIIKGDNMPEPGIPESFKVLLKELQSLALDIRVLREVEQEYEDEDGDIETMIIDEEVDLTEQAQYSTNPSRLVGNDDYESYNESRKDFESNMSESGYRVSESESEDYDSTIKEEETGEYEPEDGYSDSAADEYVGEDSFDDSDE